MAGLKPDAVVLVSTVRALKYNGGVPKSDLSEKNMALIFFGSSPIIYACSVEKNGFWVCFCCKRPLYTDSC